MQTQFLSAIIIDQESTQGRAFALMIKDLFSNITYEQKAIGLFKECQQIKLRVYTDAPQTELIAYAIEEGFNDIFVIHLMQT